MSECRVIEGDCLSVLPTLEAGSFASVVTDPPYGLNFMGTQWDGTGVAFDQATWSAVLRVLKPGGYLLAFGGTRTYHRLACAVEDAGFEVRDCLMWLYGTGFPKGQGCLKPGYEPIILARKPGPRVLPLGIDGCRVEHDGTGVWGDDQNPARHASPLGYRGGVAGKVSRKNPAGRYPANVLHDGSAEVLEAFAAFGESKGDSTNRNPRLKRGDKFGWSGAAVQDVNTAGFTDTGTAARFFFTAKASKAERAGGNHPTVKPLALMRWLVRLITPKGGAVIDPFGGSGTTGAAAVMEERRAVLIERDAGYCGIARRRIVEATGPLFAASAAGG